MEEEGDEGAGDVADGAGEGNREEDGKIQSNQAEKDCKDDDIKSNEACKNGKQVESGSDFAEPPE